MKRFKLGVIGAGNMAKAIVNGVIKGGVVSADKIIVADPYAEIGIDGVYMTANNKEALKGAEYILLAVKPQIYQEIKKELSAYCEAYCIISIMAGVASVDISADFDNIKVVRVMPNTPCMIGKGMSVVCEGDAGEDAQKFVCDVFRSLGEILVLPEEKIHAVTSVSGSGPAYVYYFIKAMVDGGIAGGLSEEESKILAINTFIGSAEMARNSSDSLETLIDKVCSKGGTTIQAIDCYRANSLDGIIKEGMKRCFIRSEELSGK